MLCIRIRFQLGVQRYILDGVNQFWVEGEVGIGGCMAMCFVCADQCSVEQISRVEDDIY